MGEVMSDVDVWQREGGRGGRRRRKLADCARKFPVDTPARRLPQHEDEPMSWAWPYVHGHSLVLA